jgi:hypothetical protein
MMFFMRGNVVDDLVCQTELTVSNYLPSASAKTSWLPVILLNFDYKQLAWNISSMSLSPDTAVRAFVSLMLNGHYDFARPPELSQAPMSRLLGAPAEQKRHGLFDTGHTLRPEQIASEVYVWLDRYPSLAK